MSEEEKFEEVRKGAGLLGGSWGVRKNGVGGLGMEEGVGSKGIWGEGPDGRERRVGEGGVSIWRLSLGFSH